MPPFADSTLLVVQCIYSGPVFPAVHGSDSPGPVAPARTCIRGPQRAKQRGSPGHNQITVTVVAELDLPPQERPHPRVELCPAELVLC